jgi:hypothetical protein
MTTGKKVKKIVKLDENTGAGTRIGTTVTRIDSFDYTTLLI